MQCSVTGRTSLASETALSLRLVAADLHTSKVSFMGHASTNIHTGLVLADQQQPSVFGISTYMSMSWFACRLCLFNTTPNVLCLSMHTRASKVYMYILGCHGEC